MRYYFLILIALLLPLRLWAASADLSISANDIRFSKETLIAGETIRLYSRIHNIGDVDVSGFVTFYQGSTILGSSQVISVLKGGSPEEVYIDFVVPTSNFNIRAEIRGTDPEETNLENNTVITGLLEPVFDADADGVADKKDNCPTEKNTSQVDADGDGKGDVCDPDDDNDGVSDEVEAELGSNPTVTDTDGDGTPDNSDAFPTDQTQQTIPSTSPVTKAPVKKTFAQIVDQVAEQINKSQGGAGGNRQEAKETEEPKEVDASTLTFSPHAVFGYTQERWDTYRFQVIGPVDTGYHYEWDFGDGVYSNKTDIVHPYKTSGAYAVRLTVQDASGKTSEETVTVLVPFFSLQNKLVVALIGLLVVLLAIAGWGLWTIQRKSLNRTTHV